MKVNNLKNLFTQDNKTILIGLLSVLIVFWIILYVIPNFFISLFNTFLGNLILLLSLILVTSQNIKYGIVLAIILIILYRFSHIKEGFTWTEESTQKFIELQDNINPKIVFDTKEIQNQASQEEVDYFLKNKMWPWSKDVEDSYKELLEKNTYVRNNPEDEMNHIKTKYNQTIIMKILALQTEALKNNKNVDINTDNRDGLGSYPYEAGLISN
jgi:hypothetical protein